MKNRPGLKKYENKENETENGPFFKKKTHLMHL